VSDYSGISPLLPQPPACLAGLRPLRRNASIPRMTGGRWRIDPR